MADNGKEKWVNTLLKNGEVEQFEFVQRHLGIRTNADVVRHLVRREAQRIARQAGEPRVEDLVAAYQAGLVTADEVLEYLVAGPSQFPEDWRRGEVKREVHDEESRIEAMIG